MSAWAGPRRRGFPLAAVAALAVALAAAGCGDDEDGRDTGSAPSAGPPTRTVTAPPAKTSEDTGTAPSPSKEKGESTTPSKGTGGTSPEDLPGGAGDEEPVRSEVVLTGKGGKIGPLLVKVPPFVSVRVVLRSGDGKPYVIGFGRRILRVGPKGARSTATFDGLRPGKRLTGVGVAGKVVIEASAEPGP